MLYPIPAWGVCYTGIGSRQTPVDVLWQMFKFSYWLAGLGLTCRSGGASGADKAFEYGAICGNGTVEIFHPWYGFEGFPGPAYFHSIHSLLFPGLYKEWTLEYGNRYSGSRYFYGACNEAVKMFKQIHPNPMALGQGGVKLQARNMYQPLGPALNQPSAFLMYWTPGSEANLGLLTGGTRTAVMLAMNRGVPVVNLREPKFRGANGDWELRMVIEKLMFERTGVVPTNDNPYPPF